MQHVFDIIQYTPKMLKQRVFSSQSTLSPFRSRIPPIWTSSLTFSYHSGAAKLHRLCFYNVVETSILSGLPIKAPVIKSVRHDVLINLQLKFPCAPILHGMESVHRWCTKCVHKHWTVSYSKCPRKLVQCLMKNLPNPHQLNIVGIPTISWRCSLSLLVSLFGWIIWDVVRTWLETLVVKSAIKIDNADASLREYQDKLLNFNEFNELENTYNELVEESELKSDYAG